MPEPNYTANPSSPEISSTIPPEVVTCLQNARFLHLATCSANIPHISLMNYTYLASSPYTTSPTIIMTTPPSSRKTHNLADNPLVSLLVHDWVSHRPPTMSMPGRSTSPDRSAAGRGSSLAELLLGINNASLSRISTTINGLATLIPSDTPEERWYKARHLENNTFGNTSDSNAFSSSPTAGGGLWAGLAESKGDGDGAEDEDEGDGGKKCFIEGEEVRVVVVQIRDGRIADWKGRVRDWVIQGEGDLSLSNGV